ncbi:hypothetical protein KUTeg_021036 [Tegillarca granosa]|uniref:PDZ domain-containing protein n=1 Tax=Tegillarca granosa TaxID=220873 RepID=A0ABQ9E9M2_TEGGR|nr:hypothetical protein KUTeg_021036 [Tegillarca granosa]
MIMDFIILKVNGTDLSQSSHEEAVEAFRTAKEPIVVEVLRRVNKTKMKNRSPTMVSIGTQTEEDIYGYNRPPTPPPAIYPFHSSGLYQPSSRRPVAFSPSADMGLTDIEMAHALEYDDAYFEERAYDVEYEEVVLHRSSTNEKLGLTLCYGSLEDEMTDIFISEVDPCSIAAQDGRIREGDQILQINGIDVHSRDQAIKLFSEQSSNITLLLARPQLQLDDGFMEDQNVVLDDLHMDILEKHHHDNMQIMASMLARGHIDEEGGTTDTATTENSLHKHEKDSGVGRTDESTKNDESSEQIYSDESFLSHDCTHDVIVNDIPSEECDKFREVLARRFSNGIENSPRNDSVRKDSRGSIEHELALLNKEMEQIQLECEEIVQSHLCEQNISQKRENTPYKSPRIVPRMGTRLEYLKHVQSYDSSEKDVLTKQGQSSSQLEKDKDATSTSAYNTGESCRSTPLTLELNPASDEGEKGFKNSMLCLAPTASTMTPSLSDTEKQTQTPCSRSKDGSSDDNLLETSPGSLKDQGGMGESLQDLYQQLDQKPRYAGSPQPGSASSRSTVHQPDDFHAQGSPNMTPPDSSSQMEWVVKRRPDGTRYITRRPVRSKMLKERAKKISEERCGMTTDDDAMSELKTGRYWSKEDRKRHLEKAKDQKRRRELMMKAKMETLKETEEKKEVNIVELSHRKMNKRKGKKVLDNFVTVQEMMAHGSRVQDGKTYNPLLSVTTV